MCFVGKLAHSYHVKLVEKVRQIEQLQQEKEIKMKRFPLRKEKVTFIKDEELESFSSFPKNNEIKDKMDNMNKRLYSFDFCKVIQNFDLLLKDKHIKLPNGHNSLSGGIK